MVQSRNKREVCKENWLTKIPVLGYFFRKLAEHRQPIEAALKTNRKTEENISRESYLGGVITVVSAWTVDTLKWGREKKK